MSSLTEIEDKIRKLKAKREALVTKKAEKVALLKRAQEDLKALKEEADGLGYSLQDISLTLDQKKKELADLVAQLEDKLNEAEAAMAAYD